MPLSDSSFTVSTISSGTMSTISSGSISLGDASSTAGAEENASTTPPEKIILHEKGDLTLLIGTGEAQQPVLVSKINMQAASPVWRAMLDGHWSESRATEIIFPEDDVDAMLLVLRIAHFRFSEISLRPVPSIHEQYQLALVCDKYDTVGLVRQFFHCEDWADVDHIWLGHEVEGLFVAYTFGFGNLFDILARFMARTISLGTKGYPHEVGMVQTAGNMPPFILESILEVRLQTLNLMLRKIYATVDKLMSTSTCTLEYEPGRPTQKGECRGMIFGRLITALSKENLYPCRKLAKDLEYSLWEFCDLFADLRPLPWEEHDFTDLVFTRDGNGRTVLPTRADLIEQGVLRIHSECALKFDLAYIVRKVYNDMASPMLDTHRKHMEKQAKK